MFNAKSLIKLAIAAAIYVVLTLISYPLSFGQVQFRVSEILLLLCFFNPKYGVSLVVGCFLSNLASPFGPIDWVLGTAHTLIAVLFIIWARKARLPLWVASFGALIGTPLIGLAINIASGLPIIISTLWVALGEFVVVTIIGVPIFKWLQKRKSFSAIL